MDVFKNLPEVGPKEKTADAERLSSDYINEIMKVRNIAQGKAISPLKSYEERYNLKIEGLSNEELVKAIRELDSKVIAVNGRIEKINDFHGSYQERSELEEELIMAVEDALAVLYKNDPLKNENLEAFKDSYFF